MKDVLYEVCRRDGRYSAEAFHFLYQALEKAVEHGSREGQEETSRHVSGHELLDSMRLHALTLFGPLAAQVWRSWGVHDTVDWGRIVFLLVEANLLNSQDTDSVDDFRDGFDFDDAFVLAYQPNLPAELGAMPAPDDL